MVLAAAVSAAWPCVLAATHAGGAEPAATSHLRFPAEHPYLTLTPQDVARAKDRAAREIWAKETLNQCLQRAADLAAKPLGKLPDKGDTRHWQVADHLYAVGLACAFSGEKRYAEWVRDGLLAYADLYPRLPLSNQRCRVFSQSSLYEAVWLVSVVRAYDLVAGSGTFTEAQRRRVETDLLRTAVGCFKIDDFQRDRRIADLHYRCYNFQAWHLAAVGLVGLALQDRALVEYALESPYGLRHLVAHDVRDDGLFWERSLGYHRFVMAALLPLTEALYHCGIDGYAMAVPNDRSRDEDAHYVTDTTDAPKSLRLMFEGPFYLAFPNLTYPALGDSDRGPLRGDWTCLVGYHRYRDPRLAWLLRRDVPVLAGPVRRGRVGLLHYYRYQYRYDDLRLDGQPVHWDRRDPTYEVRGAAVVAHDGRVSQPDRYLLNEADREDFVFEWTMTRLAESGPQDRAWVVFRVLPDHPEYRSALALAGHCRQVDRPYRFRLEVRGSETRLLCDGKVVATRATEYRHVPDWPWLIYDLPSADVPGAIPLADGRFANSGRHERGCSLFPASGVAVLREAEGDFTAAPDSTAVSLSYGPHGGGHGHPDKLNLVLYAQGRQWLPDFGSMPYESSWKAQWTAHTISHNTVVIDGISQRPAGKRDAQWPTDSARDKVLGTLCRFDPREKLVEAVCTSAYEGMTLRRAVRLSEHCVVDDLAAFPTAGAATSPRQIDYVLHLDGTLEHTSLPLAERGGTLGSSCGYQHVRVRRGAITSQRFTMTFASKANRLRVWIVPWDDAATEVIVGDGLTNRPEATMPMLVLRRRAPAARFVAVFEPVRAQNPLRDVRVELPPGEKAPVLVLQTARGKRSIALTPADVPQQQGPSP